VADEREEQIRKVMQMRNEHRQKVADLKKKRFSRIITNVLVTVILLTAIGVGMGSGGMIKVFMFLSVALLPGIAAFVTDSRPGRFASKTVLAFNIAGMSPHMSSIFYSGSPNQTAYAIMHEMQSWYLIYGFAGFGWAVVFIIPHIAEMYLEVKAAYTIKRLNLFKDALVEEWGENVKR
jgi:hypothetical protein